MIVSNISNCKSIRVFATFISYVESIFLIGTDQGLDIELQLDLVNSDSVSHNNL